MTLHDYKTGETIRPLSTEEAELYNEMSNNGTCDGGTGAVDGAAFGHNGTVFAE